VDHAAGVIHRDIKPANLFLARRDGSNEVVVKVVDFGIARARDELTGGVYRRTLTSSGLMLGTPLYMSPEQVKGPKNVDARADVWSLGIVLYEMLTGRTPHAEEETLGGLLVSICATPAPLLTDTMPDIRGPIAALVKKALEIDPKRRYASTEELLADLEEELPSGEALDDVMLAIRPASVRAESASSAEPVDPALAATAALGAGTLQSKDMPSQLKKR
jgi:serine/threonine-protein kinase